MSSDRDEFEFGELPQSGRGRRPPKRQFGAFILALLTRVSLVVVWRGTTGGDRNSAQAVTGSPASSAAILSPPPGGPSPGAEPGLAPQLQKIVDLGKPVYCGGGNLPMVALTFDDGPGPYTQYTVDTLKTAGAKATFFLVGKLFNSSTNQKESKVEAKFGDVGDHSWNHFGLAGKSVATLDAEIVRPRKIIEKYSGEDVVYFRPPWGSRDSALDAFVASQGMIEMMWTFDTHDSEGAKTDEIVSSIDKQAQPGSIILLHENRGTTRSALPAILQVLAAKGLQPVTLTTLLTQDPPTTKQLKHGQSGCYA